MCAGSSSGSVGMLDTPVWTRRQTLTYPREQILGIAPPNYEDFSLPFLLLHSDEPFVLADTVSRCQGLSVCEDAVYRALDHRLLWTKGAPMGMLYLYFNSERPPHASEHYQSPGELPLVEPEAVHMLSDFFRDDSAGVNARWELDSDVLHNPAARISTQPFEVGQTPAFGSIGQALVLDTVAGYLALHRLLHFQPSVSDSRLHLRAHYYDHGEEYPAMGHWLGIKSALGSACLGLGFGIDGCYSTLNGNVPGGEKGKYHGWLRSSVDRQQGWHRLEMILDGGDVSFLIDGELVLNTTAEGASETTEVWLVSRCGGQGIWGGLELFHYPRILPVERMGNNLFPGHRRPWLVHEEKGRWQADASGILQNVWFEPGSVALITAVKQQLVDSFSRVPEQYTYLEGMQSMLGNTYRVISINTDGMVGLLSPGDSDDIWWFPPYATAITVVDRMREETILPDPPMELQLQRMLSESLEAAPESEAAQEVPQEVEQDDQAEQMQQPPEPVDMGGLNIQCWSLPGEDDITRVDRVMQEFLQALQQAGMVMPSNIRRIQQCRVSGHSNCVVYHFGTRRLHVATNALGSGRLSLVVRCGGGYMDFVEFARRHGSLESLRLERQSANEDRRAIRFTSVLSSGKVKAVGRTGSGPSPPTPSRARSPALPSRMTSSHGASRRPSPSSGR